MARQLFRLVDLGLTLASMLVLVEVAISLCILSTPFCLAKRTTRVRVNRLVVEEVTVWPRSRVFSDLLAISISGWPGLVLSRVVDLWCMVVWLLLTCPAREVTVGCNGRLMCLMLVLVCGPRLAFLHMALTKLV